MDGPAVCTGCERLEKKIKILSSKVESNEQTIVAMKQTLPKAIQDLKHYITYKCHHESSSSNSEDIGSDPRKRKPPRLKRRPKSGYRRKKTVVFSSRRKGKKDIMKTDDDGTGIVNDGAECEILRTDRSWLLAEAIREHFVPLVSQLPFDESELSDMLIPDCLTEDETQSIRKLPSRKMKIRSLLSLLAGRDYDVLKQFLGHAKRFDEALVEAVWKTFEEKVNMGYNYPPICILCSIKNNVDVSYVIDHLYSKYVVSRNLLEKTACTRPQNNESLWDELYEMCLNHYDKPAAFASLAEALEAKGHYKHLSEKLKKSEAIDQLCMCPKLPSVHLKAPVGIGISSAPDSSDSPYTSLSIQSTSSFGENSSNEETMDPSTPKGKRDKEEMMGMSICQEVANGSPYITNLKKLCITAKEPTSRPKVLITSPLRSKVLEIDHTQHHKFDCTNVRRT